jgi:hypothetical protein
MHSGPVLWRYCSLRTAPPDRHPWARCAAALDHFSSQYRVLANRYKVLGFRPPSGKGKGKGTAYGLPAPPASDGRAIKGAEEQGASGAEQSRGRSCSRRRQWGASSGDGGAGAGSSSSGACRSSTCHLGAAGVGLGERLSASEPQPRSLSPQRRPPARCPRQPPDIGTTRGTRDDGSGAPGVGDSHHFSCGQRPAPAAGNAGGHGHSQATLTEPVDQGSAHLHKQSELRAIEAADEAPQCPGRHMAGCDSAPTSPDEGMHSSGGSATPQGDAAKVSEDTRGSSDDRAL